MSNIKNEIKIALIGKMRTGKDSIADYAIEKYGFTRFAFGDGIKKVCSELFPDQMKDGMKPRSLLQGVGQSMRKFDPDIWVNTCFREIKNEEEQREKLNLSNLLPIITDLRQPNEFAKCKEEEFIVIKIQTNDGVRLERINAKGDTFKLEDLKHETEQHVDIFGYDYIVKNNGSLEDAYEQFDYIMSEIKNESHLR